MRKIIFLFCFLISAFAEKARFDNYRVYKIKIDNVDQIKALKQLEETSDSYNFFKYARYIGDFAELMVAPHQFAHFGDITKSLKLQHELIVMNLQEVFDKEVPSRKTRIDEMEWTQYHDIETIFAWLDSLQTEFPSIVNVTTIGTSYHGRPMKMLKISKKSGNRAIFVESQIHAYEWIASATSTYFINELLRSTNPDIRDISENIDWYFLPVANPDGHAYTWTDNRNWRKTRSEHSILCAGVDPNRNFGFNWMIPDEDGNTGASQSPCSDYYSGPGPLSEPECATTDKFLSENPGIFDAFFAFHSYQHSFLYPYGNTRLQASNQYELHAVGTEAASRLFRRNGIQYSVGSWHTLLYPSAGSSMDHAYGKFGIPISYTIEMRGNGSYGNYGVFLPPEYIIPNAEEIVEALIGLVQKAREFGRFVNQS